MGFLSFRGLAALSLVSVAACVVLMALRVASAVSFGEPMHLITSGWEQESLYAVWKVIHGMQVYSDPYRIPFAASVYNWLFYGAYGEIIGACLDLFGLGEEWLPTVGRVLTLLLALGGVAVAHASFATIAGGVPWALRLAFSLFLFAGPLVGFWGFSVRPDIAAFVFDILAVFLFWRFFPWRPVLAAALCAAAAYGAWALKQGNIIIPVTVTLFLFFRRDWKPLFTFCGLLIAAYALTMVIGGAGYVAALLETARQGFVFANAVHNTLNFVLKSAPGLAAFAGLGLAALLVPGLRRRILGDQSMAFALTGLGVAAAVTLPTSAKVGASENYFFALSYFLVLAALIGSARIAEGEGGRVVRMVIAVCMLGWVANMGAVATVLVGLKGVTSVAPQHQRSMQLRRCMADLAKPVFVDDTYLSLPWMNPEGPHFSVSFNYQFDRQAGADFEGGGIGGMIERGDFASLLIDHSGDTFDGGRLDGYERRPPCADLTPFVRRQRADLPP